MGRRTTLTCLLQIHTCVLENYAQSVRSIFQADGVTNYYHTPYIIDMITYGTIRAIFLKINVSDQFIVPDQRYHQYVPGSPKARVTLFGK